MPVSTFLSFYPPHSINVAKAHGDFLTKAEFMTAAYSDDVTVLDVRMLESFGLRRDGDGVGVSKD